MIIISVLVAWSIAALSIQHIVDKSNAKIDYQRRLREDSFIGLQAIKAADDRVAIRLWEAEQHSITADIVSDPFRRNGKGAL